MTKDFCNCKSKTTIASFWARTLVLVFLVLAAILLFFCHVGVNAAGDPEKARAGKSRAERILREMAIHLKSSKAFTFHAEILFDDTPFPDLKLQYAGSIDASIRQPNRLSISYRDDISSKRFWYDGRSITLLDPTHNVYATAAAPSTIDETAEHFATVYGLTLPLGDLASSDPFTAMMEGVEYKRYVGLHDVRGVACHHLVFWEEDINWQIWIQKGEQPLPRKIVITYKTLPMDPQYIAVFSKWDFEVELPDHRFVPSLPENAIAVEFMEIKEEYDDH